MRVVYNSFHGRYSDNPRAVHERLVDHPGVEHVWLAHAEHADGFPPGVATVDIDSAEAAEVLESADLVVANTHTEVEWHKRPGAVYLQTWHGTPMKRIHHDVLWAPPGRLTRLDRDIAKWDLLVSPNAVSTPRLRAAFRFQGQILELGYPRNDVLSQPRQQRLRRKARRRLGLDEDATVVLYAPTWRDDEYFAGERAPVTLGLDVGELGERLGDDVTLLVRTHNMMTGRVPVVEGPRVRDMSRHPDIRDLHVVADALVTDYSSSMFDFAVTGKPMAFYTYDLERFRDSIRGFYFDLEPIAPGPMVTDPRDLADALLDLTALRSAFEDRYRSFQRTFCHLEDGHATDRLLAALGIGTTPRRSSSVEPMVAAP